MIINGIEITVQKKNIKNMYLRVLPPEGIVKVSAPYFVSDNKVLNRAARIAARFSNCQRTYILDTSVGAISDRPYDYLF